MDLENKKEFFCKKCLYSSKHPLGITFNHDQVCSGCQIHSEKDTIDWDERFIKLKKLLNLIDLKLIIMIVLFQSTVGDSHS